MDLGTAAQWASVIAALVVAFASYLRASRAKEFDELRDKHARTDRDMSDIKSRVDRIESELEHLPSRDMTHAIELALGEMKAVIGVLTERVNTTRDVAGRLERFLEENRK